MFTSASGLTSVVRRNICTDRFAQSKGKRKGRVFIQSHLYYA